MDKTYDPSQIESYWYQQWEQSNWFAPRHDQSTPYCIMIPPPNVTGTLHMGHGFQDTLMDMMIRYHRMKGDNTLWQVGTDHAGIATQMVVERQLAEKGQHKQDLGRDAFVEKIWEWKNHSGSTITKQLRRLGASVDWSTECFTLDDERSEAVKKVFIQLYQEGLIYRGKRLVNWDPVLRTAISDLEVIAEEIQGNLWHLQYPVVNSTESIIVATTRPETMLGDTAVAVHPDDERYQHLIGKMLALPLTSRTIPIIADETVDMTFGTGAVKITPAHDFNDYQMGQRHNLPLINIFTADAKLNDNAPEAYRGLDRFDARKKIIQDLETNDVLIKTVAHTLTIPKGDRSGVVIEPYLTDQWYVKTAPLAEPAIDAVRNGSIQFIPENWAKTYYQWMENIEDWCISRQLWWGHRIPAWYDDAGNVYVGEDEATIRQTHQLNDDIKLTQDQDVLDTWFSSALWPFSTLGWPHDNERLKTFYPTAVLVTGFDIIFFWVARMIMMGLKFTGQIPFKEIYITGLIRDSEGHKMSKSKGNILDPIDLIDGISLEDLVQKRTSALMQPHLAQQIEKNTRKEFPDGIAAFGTDALRFTYCALATHGRDIRFDLGRLEGYRNFCNKLWNASRYVMMNLETYDPKCTRRFTESDKWILSQLNRLIETTHRYYQQYRFDLMAQALYDFTWGTFCDWYLELSKPVLYGESDAETIAGTQFTLITVIDQLLKLLHPIMPFITEEIWQRFRPYSNDDAKSIMLSAFPVFTNEKIDERAEENIAWIQAMITAIRNCRGELNISPAKNIPLYLAEGNTQDAKRIIEFQPFLIKLAKLSEIKQLSPQDPRPEASIQLVGDLQLLIPIAGSVDLDQELSRLQKEIHKHQQEHLAVTTKLANTGFVDKAPAAVIEKERQREQELNQRLSQLEAQREKIVLLMEA